MTVSTINLQDLWKQHRVALHDANSYATQAEGASEGGICYVPTAAGLPTLTDKVALKTWLGKAGPSPFDLALEWKEQLPADDDLHPIQVLKTMISGQEVMEEVVLTFCHDKAINWLLPGLAPSRKVIQLPMILSVSYAGDKISTLKVFWDQASVLKQIGVFDELSLAKATALQGKLATMPMLGSSAACKAMLLGDGMNPFMSEEEAPGMLQGSPIRPGSARTAASSVLPGDSVSVASRPSIRLASQGGYKHADNDIFAPATPKGAASRVSSGGPIAAHPDRYKTHFSTATAGLAGETPTAKGKKHFKENPNYMDSQDNTMSELGLEPGHASFQRYANNEGLAQKPRPSTACSESSRFNQSSHFSLSGEYDEASDAATTAPVVRKKAFGGMATMESTTEADLTKTGKKTLGSKTASQIVIGGGVAPTSAPIASDLHGTQRPSSRVLAPPGGSSNITFG